MLMMKTKAKDDHTPLLKLSLGTLLNLSIYFVF